jgi:hypothetical protein
VRHTGWLVRGGGAIEVEDLGTAAHASSGRSGWTCRSVASGAWLAAGAPVMKAGVDLSLRRFARWVEAG